MKDFVSFISDSEHIDQFHLLSAVVDHVAPPVPRSWPISGLSILRGHVGDILPDLWQSGAPKAKEDADKVAALTLDFGSPQLTIPLTNTTFLNHRTSTLFASRFNLSKGTPELEERIEKHWQQITLPLNTQAKSVKDLSIRAPLVPLTHPRVVTESFGNIVRRVNVNNQSVPASMELEPAVDELFQRRSNLAQTPMGIWAMITPPEFLPNGASSSQVPCPDPEATFNEKHDIKALTISTSNHLQELYGQGGRLYQIRKSARPTSDNLTNFLSVSGGGGWGAKKGLLSLDPQRTHFALSEEEDMQRFMQAMDGGNFVPVGSRIQFFTSPEADDSAEGTSSGFVFGTPGSTKPASDATSTSEAVVLTDHFGALSNDGVFATSVENAAMETTPGFNSEWKLNVPHSRVFAGSQQ